MRVFSFAHLTVLALAINLVACGDSEPSTAKAAAMPTSAATTLEAAKAADAHAITREQVISHYADIAHATFADAHSTAQALQVAVNAFVAAPSAQTQQAAKDAWLAARVPYMQSEVFRFGNPLVDEWEGQVNAWPLDEGLIDYVDGDYQYALGNDGATANIIASQSIQVGEEKVDVSELTAELLADLNELGGSEANVATGYHAIEFLLWGQDLNGTQPGAGERSYTDYLTDENCTGGNCERRGQYLKVVTDLLVNDLAEMTAQWATGNSDNYRAELLAESAEKGLRKAFFGMGSLSLGELAGERMKVALEASSTEDEHDCFSDNTHNSHFYNAKGVRNVYLGEYKKVDGTVLTGPSIAQLVQAADANADQLLQSKLAATEKTLQVMVDAAENGMAFDQMIDPDNADGQKIVRDSIAALVEQTTAIEQAALALGITELNPDTADHAF
ncbi:MAG: peptidase [Gammaproteobacteria bacterium]|nr:peptidase [Gammaproteobacteria bacterium]